MGRRGALAVLGLYAVIPAIASAQAVGVARPCLSTTASPDTARSRAVTSEDLAALTDIGDPSPGFERGGLSLSPDGRYLAVPLRRANPETNRYCLGILRLDLRGIDPPLLLDSSSDLIRADLDFLGTLLGQDYPALIRPKWSPDGLWVAFEKSVAGKIMLWRARTDGSGAQPISGTEGLLRDYRWLTNDSILAVSRKSVADAERAINAEARSGYHYDERFLPAQSDRPYPLTPGSNLYQVITISSGVIRPASERERHGLAEPRPKGALQLVRGAAGETAWTSPAVTEQYAAETELHIAFRGRRPVRCGPAHCGRVEGLWWIPGRDRLVFVRREGWANSRQGVYRWDRGQPEPKRVLLTDDLLLDCQPGAEALVCAHEASLQPRRIVRVSLRDGALRPLYDPNPGFSKFLLGRVERLHWRNANGFEVYGDLVYPVGYEKGRAYPTLVTTYTSRGFLRGATGDEYPIQVFANRGYAVLSFARPIDVGAGVAGVPDIGAQRRVAQRDWADRRSVQSAIETGLQLLDVRGVADRSKIGITGLSDGSATVQFALLNSKLFAAAAVSHCCVDAHPAMADSGLRTADHFRENGLPGLDDPQVAIWSPMSLALGVDRVTAPLLIQAGSDEFRGALSTVTTLREHHKPVEMFVFPGEGHIKLQPAHRLAVYRRNVAWFDFWLMGREDPDLVGGEELRRWAALRAAASVSGRAVARP